MKRMICIFFCILLVGQTLADDIIVTKRGRKYHGKVIRITEKGFVVRTVEGSVIVLPKVNISKIYRENKVLDFEEGMSYYLEIRRPFLPFVVLGIASGAYAVNRFNAYKDEKDRIKLGDAAQSGVKDTDDKSSTYLAWSIVSGLFSIGSFYVAIRPMEVKVPIGRLKLSMTSKNVTLALHF